MTRHLGERLREARRSRGLTQQQVADRAGLSRKQIIQIEQGVGRVSIDDYARVASALGHDLTLDVARRPTLDEVQAMFGTGA